MISVGVTEETQAEDFFSGRPSFLAKEILVLRDREFKSRRTSISFVHVFQETGKPEPLRFLGKSANIQGLWEAYQLNIIHVARWAGDGPIWL